MNTKKDNRIGIIEALRGLAALFVCLFHFSKCNIDYKGSSALFPWLFQYGWCGVEAFFVVSGFIIPFSMKSGNYQIRYFFRFLAKRSLRIEPPYLISIGLIIALSYLSWYTPGFKGLPPDYSITQVLLHILYLPHHFGYQWIAIVFWTLEAEFQYYLMSGLVFDFIWSKGWKFLLAMGVLLSFSFVIPLKLFEFMPFFIMGMSVCANKIQLISRKMMLIVLLLSSLALLLAKTDPVADLVGLFAALLISFVNWSSLLTDFLGKISYSLYLIHVPIGGRLLNIFGRYADTEPKVWISLFVALMLTLLAAYLFNRLIELPFQKMSKKLSYST